MDRHQAERRALRAAAAISMTMSLLGCGAVVARAPDETQDETDGAETTSTASATTVPIETTSTATGSSTFPFEPGVLADAGVDAGMCVLEGEGEEAWAAYQACCDAVAWDWNKGCGAWGPPVPPAFRRARGVA